MSDKSPRSKQRSQKQKNIAKARVVIEAKSKQERQAQQAPAKRKK